MIRRLPRTPARLISELRAGARYLRGRLHLVRIHRQVGRKRFGAIGPKSEIFPPATITGHERIRIGNGTIFYPRSFITVVGQHHDRDFGAEFIVGDRVTVGCDLVLSCAGRIEVGDGAAIAHRVFIGDTYHEYRGVDLPPMAQELAEPKPIMIGPRSFLGTGCAIMPGVTIGEGAAVGANAVVTSDVPPHTLVVGIPARPIRRWDGTAWVEIGEEAAV